MALSTNPNPAQRTGATPAAGANNDSSADADTDTDGKRGTALIADDEPHLARALAEQLRLAWPELQIVHVARNGLEAAEHIAALQPDVAFLDIQMPGLTGLEVAQGIEGQTHVVFVTAYDEYAVQAFEQHAVDYLLKPVKTERLARTVARLQGLRSAHSVQSMQGMDSGQSMHSVQQPAEADGQLLAALQRLTGLPAPASATAAKPERLRWVRASSGELTHQVPVEEVLFFHADDKYTCVQTAEREYLIRTPIAELAALLDAADFVQVHRSTIINQRHLAGTRRDEASRLFLRIRGHAQELPVSRAYVHLFKAM